MGTLKAPAEGVTVRMYRQGLGDCFLLAFPTADAEKPFYLMIDCGVVLGTQNAPDTMTKVVADIHAATGGEIDLLAITHEHWDHVSGFLQAAEAFQGFTVKGLWFAWTEDPADELGKKLRDEFKKDLNALHMALNRAVDKQALTPVASVLEFFGAAPAKPGGEPAPNTTGAAFQAVRELARGAGTEAEYRRPGDGPLSLPGVSGARVYVLGPPHDERLLRRINPTAKGKEVYTEGLTARSAFLMAASVGSDLSEAEEELLELAFPFDSRLRIPPEEAAQEPFFQEYYGKPGDPAAWRRIDDDWLGTAGELALQLDSYTNNTSLALAIELVPSGKVLLFVADAQVGNWLSWDALTWSVQDGSGKPASVQIGDLLARTVLYKVGHHGSHNATIRGLGTLQKGLELMNHPELVAMIPVDHDMAVKKHWGKMPFDPLLKRLDEKTGNRVMRVDDPLPKPQPAGVSAADWQAFQKRFRETELYMEYTVG